MSTGSNNYATASDLPTEIKDTVFEYAMPRFVLNEGDHARLQFLIRTYDNIGYAKPLIDAICMLIGFHGHHRGPNAIICLGAEKPISHSLPSSQAREPLSLLRLCRDNSRTIITHILQEAIVIVPLSLLREVGTPSPTWETLRYVLLDIRANEERERVNYPGWAVQIKAVIPRLQRVLPHFPRLVTLCTHYNLFEGMHQSGSLYALEYRPAKLLKQVSKLRRFCFTSGEFFSEHSYVRQPSGYVWAREMFESPLAKIARDQRIAPHYTAHCYTCLAL